MKRICNRCGTEVEKETEDELKEEYPYFCPCCDENIYAFETEEVPETPDECKQKVIRYLSIEDYSPINADWIRNVDGMIETVIELLHEGIIRMRNCDGSAIELNMVGDEN